jgi:hypothetical protein
MAIALAIENGPSMAGDHASTWGSPPLRATAVQSEISRSIPDGGSGALVSPNGVEIFAWLRSHRDLAFLREIPNALVPSGCPLGNRTAHPAGLGFGSRRGRPRCCSQPTAPHRTASTCPGNSSGANWRCARARRLRYGRNLSESASPRAVAPVFALASGLLDAAFESEFHYDEGRSCAAVLFFRQPNALPS